MKLPRDLSGSDLVRHLAKLGYHVTRQTGSHVRLTTHEHGEHHVTIPHHDPLRPPPCYRTSWSEIARGLHGPPDSRFLCARAPECEA